MTKTRSSIIKACAVFLAFVLLSGMPMAVYAEPIVESDTKGTEEAFEAEDPGEEDVSEESESEEDANDPEGISAESDDVEVIDEVDPETDSEDDPDDGNGEEVFEEVPEENEGETVYIEIVDYENFEWPEWDGTERWFTYEDEEGFGTVYYSEVGIASSWVPFEEEPEIGEPPIAPEPKKEEAKPVAEKSKEAKAEPVAEVRQDTGNTVVTAVATNYTGYVAQQVVVRTPGTSGEDRKFEMKALMEEQCFAKQYVGK